MIDCFSFAFPQVTLSSSRCTFLESFVYVTIANLESKTCIKVTLKMKDNGCFHRDAYFIFIKCYVNLFKFKVNCFATELLLREMSLVTEALRPCPAVVSQGHNASEKDLLELLCLAA